MKLYYLIIIASVFLAGCTLPVAQPGDGVCTHELIASEITGYRVNTTNPNWQALMESDCGGNYSDIVCNDSDNDTAIDVGGNPLLRGEVIVDTANSLLKSKAPTSVFFSGNDTCADSTILYQGSCSQYHLLNATPYDCSNRTDNKTACYNGKCIVPDSIAPTLLTNISNITKYCVNCVGGVYGNTLDITGTVVDEAIDTCSYNLSGIIGSLTINNGTFNASADVTGWDANNYSLKVSCIDMAGNIGNDTMTGLVIDKVRPTFNFIDPSVSNSRPDNSFTGIILLETSSSDADIGTEF